MYFIRVHNTYFEIQLLMLLGLFINADDLDTFKGLERTLPKNKKYSYFYPSLGLK